MFFRHQPGVNVEIIVAQHVYLALLPRLLVAKPIELNQCLGVLAIEITNDLHSSLTLFWQIIEPNAWALHEGMKQRPLIGIIPNEDRHICHFMINDYATNRAIDGLFVLVAREEANIRANPIARTTELLQKVFGSLDN